MLPLISSFALGILFAIGLAVSEMIDPARVIGFLDVAGRWDPTLLGVMGGALAVTLPLFPWIQKRRKSLLGEPFHLPSQTRYRCPPGNRRGDLRYRLGSRRSLPRTGDSWLGQRLRRGLAVCPGDDRRTMAGGALEPR